MTVALGMTAPVESMTVPTMSPVMACAMAACWPASARTARLETNTPAFRIHWPGKEDAIRILMVRDLSFCFAWREFALGGADPSYPREKPDEQVPYSTVRQLC